jgi:hypothetical protein
MMLRRCWHFSTVEKKNLSFFNGVIQFRHRQATNLRDKIYGVAGLLRDPIDFVDYNALVEECYTTFAMKSIEKSGSLDIFAHLYNVEEREQASYIRSILRRPALPSWVPDWSLEFKIAAQHEFQVRADMSNYYRASKSTKAVTKFTPPGTLRLKGIIFDQVSALGEANDDSRVIISPPLVLSWAKLAQVPIFGKAEHLKDLDDTVEWKIEMFRNTLSCGMLPGRGDDNQILRQSVQTLDQIRRGGMVENFDELLFLMWYRLAIDEEAKALVSEGPNANTTLDVVDHLMHFNVLPYWNIVS